MTGIENARSCGNNAGIGQPYLACQFCPSQSDTPLECRHSAIDDKGQVLSLLQKDCAGSSGSFICLLALNNGGEEEENGGDKPLRTPGSC
jgi:hypothetical protein